MKIPNWPIFDKQDVEEVSNVALWESKLLDR